MIFTSGFPIIFVVTGNPRNWGLSRYNPEGHHAKEESLEGHGHGRRGNGKVELGSLLIYLNISNILQSIYRGSHLLILIMFHHLVHLSTSLCQILTRQDRIGQAILQSTPRTDGTPSIIFFLSTTIMLNDSCREASGLRHDADAAFSV